MGKVDQYKEIRDRFSMFFTRSDREFNELVWKLVNDLLEKNTRICLHAVIVNEGFQLAMVYENISGFVNTTILFNEEIVNYDVTNSITESLNKALFGLEHKDVLEIVLSSMK